MKEQVKEILERRYDKGEPWHVFVDEVAQEICQRFEPKGAKPPVLNDEEIKDAEMKAAYKNYPFATKAEVSQRKKQIIAEAQRDADLPYIQQAEAKIKGLQVDIESLSHAQGILSKKLDDVELAIQQARQEVAEVMIIALTERIRINDIGQAIILVGHQDKELVFNEWWQALKNKKW